MTADEYLKHWKGREVWKRLVLPHHQERLRRCASYLPPDPAGFVEGFVDVGSALGHSTAILRGLRPGRWTGVDFSREAIDTAARTFADIVFVYLEKVEELALLPRFAGVVCSEVIEHVEDDEALIRGLWAITGGTLVLTTPKRIVDDPGHLRLYSRETLDKLLRDAGVQDVRIETSSRYYFVVARRGEA
jgi:2-polyprenyl-3-methyl-5-hydroxy-6-metoxy-1,4-benzoquinol methylase